ncbi:hypothetical protein HAX54_015755 [Datura stramonium]|uniref:histone acetyltransferase n=1 Tax=Datura stramonium TaxID=4076 RepID=A0ABS8UID0_DATST|nr:hypothetical protein [Datura stramonium]
MRSSRYTYGRKALYNRLGNHLVHYGLGSTYIWCFGTEQKLEDRERHLINQKDNHILHPSKIKEVPHDTKDEDENLKSEVFNLRQVSQIRNSQDLLVHGSQCCDRHCQYPNCRKVKELFHHGTQCKIQVAGGCLICKKMWFLFQLHARSCKESECNFPCCRYLKEQFEQSNSRRRAAVMEMMKQRAKNFAGGSW